VFAVAAVVAICLLEAWRRSVAPRTPRWIAGAVIASYVAIVGGVMFTWFGLQHAFGAVATTESSAKATLLAEGISHAMYGTAAAIACALAAAILLAVVTLRRATR
jgi:hypothetical protein